MKPRNSTSVSAFARLLALVRLPQIEQLRATSFRVAQLHDEVDVSETQCPCCVKPVCSCTESPMGSEVSGISCAYMEHLCAAAQCVQRKPEKFQVDCSFLVMASVNFVE